jgi:hypothetical protein
MKPKNTNHQKWSLKYASMLLHALQSLSLLQHFYVPLQCKWNTADFKTIGNWVRKFVTLISIVPNTDLVDSPFLVIHFLLEKQIISLSFWAFVGERGLGSELRASCLQIGERVSQSICLGYPQTAILLISASQVTRITGISHQCPAILPSFIIRLTCDFSS